MDTRLFLQTIVSHVFAVFSFLHCVLLGGAKIGKPDAFMASVKGKHMVITGGSSGIGLAVAELALKEGAFVSLVARNPTRLRHAQKYLEETLGFSKENIMIKELDVIDSKATKSVMQEICEWRPIDILLSNAGVEILGLLDTLSVEVVDSILKTNILGAVYTVHATLSHLKERSRSHPISIVFMGSLAGMQPFYASCLYSTSKFALRGFAENLKLELLPYNIRVSVIYPSFTETPMLDAVDAGNEFMELMKSMYSYDRDTCQTAKEVAQITIKGMKEGKFIVPTERIGFLLTPLSRGIFPPESLSSAIVELSCLVPLQLNAYLACFHFYRALLRNSKVQKN